MKKVLAPIIVILILAGSVYAALVGGLFPNTGDFPRVPQTNGTLGNILAKILGTSDIEPYEGDGTVNNTLALNGITSTGYLQQGTCTVIDQVWTNITPEGTAICDLKGGVYSQVMGTLTGVVGSIKIYDHNGLEKTGIDGFTLHFGDIVETLGSSSGTISFSDASIIRLDELTTVTLSGGMNSSGNTIAQLILTDGNLWGRVLTSTGINFEAGGYIAGVRGTSISIEEGASEGMYTFAVIDSLSNGDDAVGIRPTVVVGGTTIKDSTTKLGSGSITEVRPKEVPIYTRDIPKSTLLTGNAWRANNTIADIEYLMQMESNSEELSAELRDKVAREFEVTTPKFEDLTTCNAIDGKTTDCSEDISPDNVPEVFNTTNVKKELKARNMVCRKKYASIFWPTIGKCVKKTDTEKILFAADYTDPTTAFSDSSLFTSLPDEVNSIFKDFQVVQPFFITVGSEKVDISRAMLRGRTVKVAPMHEETIGFNTLNVETSLNSINNPGTSDPLGNSTILTIKGEEYVQRALDDILSRIPTGDLNLASFRGNVESKKSLGFTQLLIKKGTLSPTTLLTFRKPSHFPTPTPNGISINTNGDFIAYSLSELGGGASLVNKWITIKIDGTPTSGNTLIDFGYISPISYRIIKYPSGTGYKCTWMSNNTDSINCVTVVGNTLTFQVPYIPGGNTIKYLVLGNNYDTVGAMSSLSKPIGGYIQGIQIKGN